MWNVDLDWHNVEATLVTHHRCIDSTLPFLWDLTAEVHLRVLPVPRPIVSKAVLCLLQKNAILAPQRVLAVGPHLVVQGSQHLSECFGNLSERVMLHRRQSLQVTPQQMVKRTTSGMEVRVLHMIALLQGTEPHRIGVVKCQGRYVVCNGLRPFVIL